MIRLPLKTRVGQLLVVFAVLLLISACAATRTAEQIVEERAMERWIALLSDDLTGAYEYLSPGYRSSVSVKNYQRALLLKKIKWNDAKVIESECEETTCKIKISLNYTAFGAVPGLKSFDGVQTIEESWVLVNGNWFLVPED
jgi:hypothetical protein